ncbi:hypothetical protein AC629_27885 [Bradyrhizobium sp. NAS80.1]|uniref:hypothetical protein n=1 Tax=Bradyrhizobium sp. NAS80.1 TaxID=1680159 RepID=UPI00095FE91E|nr:hypothetical protein [Bradyrhizobium sp. NAS80.1]OKO80154.1 hypothetical protein AC629_27885 [Bradyrhizobium sp. NAS80.1]
MTKAPDRLHDLRERIAELKVEEAELRAGLISGALPLDGDDFTVEIETRINERLDLAAMRAAIPESIWSPFLLSSSCIYVKTRKRAGDG